MRLKLWLMLALAATGLPACTPLVVAGAGAVVADEILEDRNNDDGLF